MSQTEKKRNADRPKGTRSQVVVAGAIAGLISRYAGHTTDRNTATVSDGNDIDSA